jgi:hypothetical protein
VGYEKVLADEPHVKTAGYQESLFGKTLFFLMDLMLRLLTQSAFGLPLVTYVYVQDDITVLNCEITQVCSTLWQ